MKERQKKGSIVSEYKPKVVVFGSRNAINDSAVKKEVENLGKFIAGENLVLANGGSNTGVMGHMAKVVFESGGETYGIGLHEYEPYDSKTHRSYTNHEGYISHWERQRRLIEIGDIFIAFKGGFGTLHEIIDIYLMQGLAEIKAPLILIGDYMKNFQLLIDFFEKEKMGRHMQLGSNIHYVKTAKEAEPIIRKHIEKLKKENYYGPDFYPVMGPEEIYNHIRLNSQPYYIAFENVPMKVLPDVFPSNRFRSSKQLGAYIKDHAKGKKILDMGCASGSIGLVAAKSEARSVVQVDLNKNATNNARVNAQELNVDDICDIYTGDGFKPIMYKYKNYFDIILFNPPFHSEVKDLDENTELMYGFYTQGLEGGILDVFFRQAKDFLSMNGEIIISYSNKDPKAMRFLEEVMKRHGYSHTVEILSENSDADVRIYRVKPIKLKSKPKKSSNQLFKLGLLLASTGNARVDGLQMKQAIELATEELNETGNKIELGFANDESSVTKAVSGAVKLVESFNPHTIIGPTWSEYIDSVSKYYEEHKIPYYIPATSLDLLYDKDLEHVLAGSYSTQGKENVIQEWVEKEQYKEIIYVTNSKVLWGSVHQDIFRKVAEKTGRKFVNIELEKNISMSKLPNIINKIKKQSNPLIIIDNYENFFYDFLSQMKKNKIHTPVICTLNIAEELKNSIKKLEPSSALYELKMPVPKRFTEKYENKFKQKPSRYAFNAYIGMFVLAKAFREDPKNVRKWIINNWADEIYKESSTFSKTGQIKGNNWEINRIKI